MFPPQKLSHRLSKIERRKPRPKTLFTYFKIHHSDTETIDFLIPPILSILPKDTMTIQRILVTGGAGFLGSHLCEHLLKQGHHVICMDNFFTGSKKNVSSFQDSPSFEVVTHDVTEPFTITPVDQVYHLACPASPVHYQDNAIFTIRTAVLGSLNALEFAEASNARILLASTSEVYGDPTVHPQPESYWGHVNPCGPRSCYDEVNAVLNLYL